MKDTIPSRAPQTDAYDDLDMFSSEREPRSRGDEPEIDDVIRPDTYANESSLPWHEDSAEAIRRAAFADWRSRLFKLCLAGALVAGALFLIPVVRTGSFGPIGSIDSMWSWWRSAEPVPTEQIKEGEPNADASATARVDQPMLPGPPALPTPQAPPIEPLTQPSRGDPPPTIAGAQPGPSSRPVDAGRSAAPPAIPRTLSGTAVPPRAGASEPASQSGRAGSSTQSARLGLEPPLSQRGANQSTPTDVSPPLPAPTASVPSATPRAADPPPPAVTTEAPAAPTRNVPLIGQRNVPIVRDRNVPIVGDRNVPRAADRTATPPAGAPASGPAGVAPSVTPPAAASSAAAPVPPPAAPAPSTAPAPPRSTAAAAPSPAAAAPPPAPGAPASPPAAAARPAAAVVPPALELDRREINGALARYKGAFNALDASAAASVWPTVDRGTLSRAFQRLRQQEVAFDDCQIDVKDVRASATCRGTLLFVPRVGTSTPQIDRRQWTFGLAKVREEWVIQTVDTR